MKHSVELALTIAIIVVVSIVVATLMSRMAPADKIQAPTSSLNLEDHREPQPHR